MLISWHMLFVFIWAITLMGSVKAISCNDKDAKILTYSSFIFMIIVLVLGVKIMLLMPQVTKSGMWIHIKLSIVIVAMLINLFLLYLAIRKKTVSKKVSYILFWALVIMFILMYYVTLFKPF